MAFCRERLFSGEKRDQHSQNFGLIQTLDFNDSDGEFDSSLNDASMESVSPVNSRGDRSPMTWGRSTRGDVTPNSSPKGCRRIGVVSPLPFDCGADIDSDEDLGLNCRLPGIPPMPHSPQSPSLTPPHKKLRGLRLYDTPHTPKSLLQKAQGRRITRINRSRLADIKEGREGFGTGKTPSPRTPELDLKPLANVNIFTPNNNQPSSAGSGQKRPRGCDGSILDETMDESMEELNSSKKMSLHQITRSRYQEEYLEICKLGDGEFGSVFKCIHRLDGLTYAVKKSKMPIAGSVYERMSLREVHAHAVMGRHQHVVQYYNAWAEDDHMYIQNEYCNGGSLADSISARKGSSPSYFTEEELKQILVQIADGLKWFHSHYLVHLDIKPGNIFIQKVSEVDDNSSGDSEDIDEDDIELECYKIGDLGHVTKVGCPEVEEGDCRYLSNEVLQEQLTHLTKADIFALALTVYEAASLTDLPKNGEDWHRIRRGELPYLNRYSEEFNNLLKLMVHPDPCERPSATAVTQQFGLKSRTQLWRELKEERASRSELHQQLNLTNFKYEILQREFRQLQRVTENQEPYNNNRRLFTTRPMGRESRLIGRKVNRSMSLT